MVNTETEQTEKIKVVGDDLKFKNVWSYGVGHFMNDICASSWFFFLSYYLIQIIKLDDHNASYVLLAGQISDAIATPLVGIFSDKTTTRLGKRTPWYIGGTILVAFSFTLIFFSILPSDSSENDKLIYYSVCASLFNIGWAAVQVSHMALLPSITLNKKKKDFMTRIRTGFTFLAQMITLGMSFFFFYLITNKYTQYKALAGTSIIMGLIFSILFLFMCKEAVLAKNIPSYYENIKNVLNESENKLRENSNLTENFQLNYQISKTNELDNKTTKDEDEITWLYWLGKADFYYYIFVYMFVRLSINITSSVIPFYMEFVLKYPKTGDEGTPIEITVCLFISTLGSIFNSLVLQKFIEEKSTKGNKRIVLIGISTIFVGLGCLPLYFLNEDTRMIIFFLCFIWGIGFSQGLSCVSSLINDVVGSKGDKGAFVYGAFSFADKLSCGLVLLIFLPHAKDEKVLRYTIPFLPPASLIFGTLFVLLRIFVINKKNEQDFLRFSNPSCSVESNRENFEKSKLKNIIDNPRLTFISNREVILKK